MIARPSMSSAARMSSMARLSSLKPERSVGSSFSGAGAGAAEEAGAGSRRGGQAHLEQLLEQTQSQLREVLVAVRGPGRAAPAGKEQDGLSDEFKHGSDEGAGV